MHRRIDSLQTMCDFTRGAGSGLVYLTIAELEGLLAVVKAAQAMMRDHHAYAGREGRVCIDVPVGAFCGFATKLAHLTHSPCDEVQP